MKTFTEIDTAESTEVVGGVMNRSTGFWYDLFYVIGYAMSIGSDAMYNFGAGAQEGGYVSAKIG